MHSCPPAILQVLASRDATVLCSLSRTLCVTLLSLASLLPGSWFPAARGCGPRADLGFLPLRSLGLLVRDQPIFEKQNGSHTCYFKSSSDYIPKKVKETLSSFE